MKKILPRNTAKTVLRLQPKHKEAVKGLLLVAPSILLLLTFTVYPIFYLLYSSVLDGTLISPERHYVGMRNYQRLWESKDFHLAVGNTLVYSVGLVFFLMVLGTLLAVWVNSKHQKRLNNLLMAAAFTPHIISLVSVSSVFLWIMNKDSGIINYLLQSIGLPAFPFLASSKTALASLVMMMIWKSVGYYAFLILAALQQVPTEIYEAAELDNTPKIRVFFRITLPMISPTLFFTTIVATINSFQVFDSVNLMTQGGPVDSTNTLVYMIYSDAFKYFKLGPASAEAVVLIVLVGILTILYFAMLNKKVHYQ